MNSKLFLNVNVTNGEVLGKIHAQTYDNYNSVTVDTLNHRLFWLTTSPKGVQIHGYDLVMNNNTESKIFKSSELNITSIHFDNLQKRLFAVVQHDSKFFVANVNEKDNQLVIGSKVCNLDSKKLKNANFIVYDDGTNTLVYHFTIGQLLGINAIVRVDLKTGNIISQVNTQRLPSLEATFTRFFYSVEGDILAIGKVQLGTHYLYRIDIKSGAISSASEIWNPREEGVFQSNVAIEYNVETNQVVLAVAAYDKSTSTRTMYAVIDAKSLKRVSTASVSAVDAKSLVNVPN